MNGGVVSNAWGAREYNKSSGAVQQGTTPALWGTQRPVGKEKFQGKNPGGAPSQEEEVQPGGRRPFWMNLRGGTFKTTGQTKSEEKQFGRQEGGGGNGGRWTGKSRGNKEGCFEQSGGISSKEWGKGNLKGGVSVATSPTTDRVVAGRESVGGQVFKPKENIWGGGVWGVGRGVPIENVQKRKGSGKSGGGVNSFDNGVGKTEEGSSGGEGRFEGKGDQREGKVGQAGGKSKVFVPVKGGRGGEGGPVKSIWKPTPDARRQGCTWGGESMGKKRKTRPGWVGGGYFSLPPGRVNLRKNQQGKWD